MRQDMLMIEELETRYELASFALDTAEDAGCCSGSCCLVGGNCTPAPAPEPAPL